MAVKPIRINMATIQYVNRRLARLLMVAAALTALVATGCNLRHHLRLQTDIVAYSDRIESLRQRQSELISETGKDGIDEKEMEAIRGQTRFVNRLIARDVFPWDSILSAVETGMPENVYLASLSPDAAFQNIVLTGFATSLSEVSNYLKGKETVDLFQDFKLVQTEMEPETETETVVARDQLPVRFEIEVHLQLENLFPVAEYGSLAESLLSALKKSS